MLILVLRDPDGSAIVLHCVVAQANFNQIPSGEAVLVETITIDEKFCFGIGVFDEGHPNLPLLRCSAVRVALLSLP